RAQDSYPPVGGHGFNSRLRYKKALTQQLELFLFWSAGFISASWRTRVQFPCPLQESSNSTVGAFSFLERRNHIRQLADTGSIPVSATRKLQLNSWSFFFFRAQESYPPVGGHGFNSRPRYKKAPTQQLELFLFRAQESYPPVGGHGFNSRLRYKKRLSKKPRKNRCISV